MPDLRECMRIAAAEPGSVLLQDCRDPSRSKLFTQPVEWLNARRLSDLPGLFARLQKAQMEGLWAAGYVGYECGYHWEPTAAPFIDLTPDLPLPAFGLYHAPIVPVPFAQQIPKRALRMARSESVSKHSRARCGRSGIGSNAAIRTKSISRTVSMRVPRAAPKRCSRA